jgi:hypothetical protein
MNKIDELIQGVAQDRKQQIDLSVSQAAKKSPDQSAKVYNLSQERNLPFEYVDRHYDRVRTPATDDLKPSVAQLLRDRRKAEIAYDDIDNLSWWETAAQEGKNLAKLLPSTAFSVSSAGYSALGSVFNTLSEGSLAPIRALNLASEDEIQKGDWLGMAGDYMMEIARDQSQGSQKWFPTDSAIPRPVLGGLQSVVTNVPALLAGLVTRDPNVALGAMGGVTYGNSYLKGKESGLDDMDALVYAINNSLAEVVTEKIPATRLLGDIGANAGFFETVARQMAAEIPGEQIATIWQDVNEWASINPDKSLKEFLAERPDAAVDTLISTVVATGLQTSAIYSLNAAAQRSERQAIDELVAKSQESKVNGRSPEVFADYVQQVAEKYDSVQNVYLNASEARTLFQDLKQDAARNLISEQIDEAEAVGGDIVIPIGQFVSQVAKSENYNILKDYFRLSPESRTELQAESVLSMMAEANQNIEARDRADEIYREVSNQLINTGRLDKESAKASAAIIPAYVTARATRSGLSVDEVYEMMGLSVVGPETDLAGSQGVILDQAKEQGYQGESMGEALEWRRAVDKFGPEGMMTEARLARAQEMGFNTEQVYYRGMRSDIEEMRKNDNGVVFVTPDPEYASDPHYGGREEGAVYPLYLSAKNVFDYSNADHANLLRSQKSPVFRSAANGDFRALQDADVVRFLMEQGFDGFLAIEPEGQPSLAVFDASSIRSVNAAFDPDFKDSPRLLSQSYTPEDLDFFKSQGLLTDEEAASLEGTGDRNETTQPQANKEPRATRTVGGAVPREQWVESTAVQTDGRPTNVYRGASQRLTAEDFGRLGQATGHPTASLGVWFSTDQADAATYGEPSEYQLDIRNPKVYSIAEELPSFDAPEAYTELREQLQSEGFDGIVLDYSDIGGPQHIVAFEPDQVVEPGTDLYQGEKEGPRGIISLLPKESIIQLTKASDLSTFLHESGHLFLEMEGRLYSHANATDEIKRDGKVILDWLGAKSFNDINTEQHEQFARGFEKYLGEGKAPSVELQGVFRRFAAWIKQVYRSLTRLNVELSDDMRAVFDRMLATDDQISRMRGRFQPLFESAEDAGVTEAEYRAYREKSTPDVAKEKLRATLLSQLERQHKKWWKDESAVIAKKIREDLLQKPTYQAVNVIKGGEFKLNRQDVKDVLGVSKLPNRFNGLTSEEGMALEDAAARFGLPGHDLVERINTEPTLKQAVDELTYQEMVRRHGDAMTDGTLEQMAEQAAHDTEYAKKLATELSYLSRKTGTPALDRQAIKEYARTKIGSLPYTKIYPNRYRAAEVRAARETAVAKANGDNEAALRHKQQELVNFYLSREAQQAQDKAQKIRASLKAIQTRKYDSKKIDTDMVNEAKVLISAFDFRKNNRESMELAKARLTSVKNWIHSQQVDPESVSTFVEAEILGKLIPYNEMSFDDLKGLNDVVKSIMFGAKKAVEADSEAYKKAMAEGAEYLKKNRIETYETEIDTNIPWVKAKSNIQELFASLRKMESLVRQADGMNEQGWLWRHAIKPLLDASNSALAMRTRAHKELNEIFKGYEGALVSFSPVQASKDVGGKLSGGGPEAKYIGVRDRRTFKLDSGQNLTMGYEARIALALNMGNDSNMEALLTQGMATKDSKPYMTENDINKIVATLSDKDWELIQNIWDYIDTYWSQISDLEIRRSGVAPQKVTAREFTTPSGKVMRGGYYPLAGDPIEDSKQLDQDISAQADIMKQGGMAKKTTKHGSTIERVGFDGKKVDLSISVLFNHIDGVIHDVTHWEAVRDVDRVLRNPKIQNELNTSLGKPGARAIKDRLTEVAAGPQRINGMRGWNRVLRHARMAATFGALGYSVRTSITNMLGITAAAMEMDARTVASGAAEYYSNIKSNNEMILAKSKYMRDRGEVLNRDIAFIRNNLKGDTKWNAIKDNAFWMMTQTDKAITRPIWMAAYRQGETMFDTEQEAIDHADRMVARTQGSGMDMDLSNVETRNELMKTMTVMYSAMNAIYNITTEQVKRRKAGKISTMQLATKLTWGIVVAGIAEEMIRGSWGDDEDETFAEGAVKSTANMALSLIPAGRDIASYAQYGFSFPTPLLQLGKAPVDAYKQARQGELDMGLIRSLTSMSSWALVPGGAQFNRTAGYLIDLNEGEIDSFSPWEMIVTGKESD